MFPAFIVDSKACSYRASSDSQTTVQPFKRPLILLNPEPCFSIKIYLSGIEILIHKTVVRQSYLYTEIPLLLWFLYWNALLVIERIHDSHRFYCGHTARYTWTLRQYCGPLSHWGLNIMAAILQMTFASAFAWIKIRFFLYNFIAVEVLPCINARFFLIVANKSTFNCPLKNLTTNASVN